MNLKQLSIDNFLAIGKGDLDFSGARGVRLIEGKNHDSPSSISNGSGKSTLPEAVQWGLFGTTRRGLKGDDVINRTAGKNCAVELFFDDYLVGRYRKHDTYGSTLKLWQIDGNKVFIDLTKGTVKETQELLESIIKLSEFTYSKVAYFGQGDVKGFAGLTDADLKKVFEQALGVAYFQEYLEKAKAHRQGLESDLESQMLTKSQADRDIEHTSEKIGLLKQSIEEEKKRLAVDKKANEEKLDSLKMSLANLKKLADEEVAKIEIDLKGLAGKENDRIKLAALEKPLREQIRNADQSEAKCQAGQERLESEIKEAEEGLNTLHFKIGKPCGECGKTYETQDLEPARVNLNDRLEFLRKTFNNGATNLAELKVKTGKLNGLLDQLTKKIETYEPARIEAAGLRQKVEGIKKNLEERAREHNQEIADITKKINAPSGASRAEQDLKMHEDEKMRFGAIQHIALIEIGRLEGEIEIAKMLEEAMGNGGLKSYVFDAITPELNKAIDQNIKMLDDIDIEVGTVSKLKSGEFREKFNIKVDNRHGAEQFEGNSGGEQQKINLAISLAFNTVARGIAGGTVNCIWLDECFENMDEGSSEKVLDLIQTLSVPNVFLITHRQGIKELVTDVVTVEKQGGVATIH